MPSWKSIGFPLHELATWRITDSACTISETVPGFVCSVCNEAAAGGDRLPEIDGRGRLEHL